MAAWMCSSDKMKAFFSLLLIFGAIFVCSFTPADADDGSQAVAAYPYLIFEPALESIDNLYRAILGLYRSCIIALRKYFSEKLQEVRNGDPSQTSSVAVGGLYKFQIWKEQNYHYTGTLQEMIFYMQREVNEAESNLEIIIKYFSGLADGSIPPPGELSARTVQLIITIWVQLQDSINRLSYDIDVFRSYITTKIDSLKNRFGEGTFDLHSRMKVICHEVDTRSQYWIKIVGPVFRKALALPHASYYIVSLEMFYAEWQTLFPLPPEATVVEILIQNRAITNTIHNAAQVNFFLSVSMRVKIDAWPYLNLIFQDSANVKRFVDRGFTRIESFIRCSLNRIQEQLQAENYDQADVEMQNVKDQVESDIKAFIDFTETPYRRIYDASYAEYFDVYATDLRYTDAFQNLLWYLVDQGFAISWPENEFAPIMERITVVALSDTDYPGGTQYSKNNFRSLANANNVGNDSRYLQMSLNAYHLILHENLLLDIISIYQSLLNDLRNTLPQDNASKAVLLNLREDAILFAQGFQYLRMYVSQSGLFIDWVHVENVEEYINLLTKLDLDVLHRIDILCYRVLITFKRALDYLYIVNSGSLPAEVIPQEEIPVQNTEITPRELIDILPTETPVTGNINGGVRPYIGVTPSFWMGRRLLNRHGKLPNYIRVNPSIPVGTPTIVIPTEVPGIVEEIPISGAELPTNTPITSVPFIITPRSIPNNVHVGKRQPIPRRSPYPTQPVRQIPIDSGGEIVPEVIVEVPGIVENTPNGVIQTPPTLMRIPIIRFLNEWPFGKRIKILPRSYHPSAPLVVINPPGEVPIDNIIAAEPILPTNTYVNNPVHGSSSSPRSLNEGFFGKRQGMPVSSPQTSTPSVVTNPVDIYQGNGGNVEVTTPEESIPPTVLPRSAGGLNGGHFGKIEEIPRSITQPTTTPVEIPGQIPTVEINGEPQEGLVLPSEYNEIPQEEFIQPAVELPEASYGLPTITNEMPDGNVPAYYDEIPQEEYIQPAIEQPEASYGLPTITNEMPDGNVPAYHDEIPQEEYIQPAIVQPEASYGLPIITNEMPDGNVPAYYDEIPQEEYIQPAIEPGISYGLPTVTNEIPDGNVPAYYDEIPQEEYIQPATEQPEESGLPTVTSEIPDEEQVQPIDGNTEIKQEEISAALNLLSSMYETRDFNNDGSPDILIINPDEANAGLFEGIGIPRNTDGPTTIMIDQNTEGRQTRESTLEGSGYFDENGILHDGNLTGTQHEETEINSNTVGLVDFQSDGTIDMGVENESNRIINEDTTTQVLGDLTPGDGILTNTVIQTSLTTQETTSMTTYVIGEEEPLAL